MKSPRLVMIGRIALFVILATDFAWMWRAVVRGRSIFGFDARGFDGLILPMATLLALGPVFNLPHRRRTLRFQLGFEVCGCLAILACAICGWVSPTTLRTLLRPVYLLWALWSPWHPPDVYLFPATTLLITGSQWLVAMVGGWLAENEKQGISAIRLPRVRWTMRRMMGVVAIAALVSLGLAQWLKSRQENDPWRNAVRWSEEHEARAREHLEAARLYPETAEVRLRMAMYEKSAARSFQAEAKLLKP